MSDSSPIISKNFSLYEISERSGITVSALRNAISRGELPAFTIQTGKSSPLYIAESDFNDFISRRKAIKRTELGENRLKKKEAKEQPKVESNEESL